MSVTSVFSKLVSILAAERITFDRPPSIFDDLRALPGASRKDRCPRCGEEPSIELCRGAIGEHEIVVQCHGAHRTVSLDDIDADVDVRATVVERVAKAIDSL